MRSKIVASELLLESVQRHQIHLSVLVADTGLWANPEVHRRLLRDTGSVAMSPRVRRARGGQNERPGQIVDGVRLDSNTYANVAIKRAVGLVRGAVEGFEACHIWPLTCYDERYHTAPANLVLLPRAIAGLSDHDPEIQRALQYRAFELYGWWPEELSQPEKPEFYPSEWAAPQPDPLESRPARMPRMRASEEGVSDVATEETRRTLADRIRAWSQKPELNVHKTIALVVAAGAGIPRDELVTRVGEVTGSKNPYGAVSSLFTNAGAAYGRVFEDVHGMVRLHPDVSERVLACTWMTPSGTERDRSKADELWQRVEAHQGELFTTVSGKPFSYRVTGRVLTTDRTDFKLSSRDFETALAMEPTQGPGELSAAVRGPSYVWAILHDPRTAG